MKSFLLTTAIALGIGAAAFAQQPYGYDPRNNGYGRYDQRGAGPAYQYGLEDGRRDGERDMMSRHSYRPEHNGNFKHADRGYHRGFGDRQLYKNQYRAGYMEGYRMGYRSGGPGRRW